MQADPFWQINAGNVITIVSIIASLLALHSANQKKIQEGASELQDIKSKVNIMYNWFEKEIINGGND